MYLILPGYFTYVATYNDYCTYSITKVSLIYMMTIIVELVIMDRWVKLDL